MLYSRGQKAWNRAVNDRAAHGNREQVKSNAHDAHRGTLREYDNRRKNVITINFRRSTRISWIGAGPPPWRTERARGGAAKEIQRRSKKSARTSESLCQVAKEPPRRPPRGQNPSNTYRKSMTAAFQPFRFRWPSEASKWLQEGLREPQEGPKRVPRRPQERP